MSEDQPAVDGRTTDPECLFCRIATGEVPAEVVHDEEAALAFRDLDPKAPTHVLVIPRHHVRTVAQLADERPDDVAALVRVAATVAAREGVAESGYRSVFNSGPDAGQSVFHAHVHVLGGRSMAWPPG